MVCNSFILRNGHVIDPANKLDTIADIVVIDGKIASIDKNIRLTTVLHEYDLKGLIVTPGLVDSHVHCYFTTGIQKAWAGDYSLQPDFISFRSGVTTIVDAGSSGCYNFEHFKTTVIDRFQTRIYALLNICDYGMSSLQVEQFPDKNDISASIECIDKYKDVIKGIKVAHYWGKDWRDIECAKNIQKNVAIKVPIMVDFGKFRKERPYDELVLSKLDSGDISTHCFRSAVPVLDSDGKVYDYLWEARKRGIKFDLGHGASSFMLRNGVPAMRQGFLPDSFSSDLHALSINDTVISMSNLLSKVLACVPEISLLDLFSRSTNLPAKMLNLDDNIGTLNLGGDADIAVWSIQNGEYGFKDMGGGYISGTKRLECEMTFRAGRLVWDLNGRDGIPFEQLPPLYGLDEKDDELIVPSFKY